VGGGYNYETALPNRNSEISKKTQVQLWNRATKPKFRNFEENSSAIMKPRYETEIWKFLQIWNEAKLRCNYQRVRILDCFPRKELKRIKSQSLNSTQSWGQNLIPGSLVCVCVYVCMCMWSRLGRYGRSTRCGVRLGVRPSTESSLVGGSGGRGERCVSRVQILINLFGPEVDPEGGNCGPHPTQRF
jgi:hypothetical protein